MTSAVINWATKMSGRLPLADWLPATMRGLARRTARLLLLRHNARTMDRLISGRCANLDDIASFLSTQATPLSAPLVLISQAQRSGGSLLNQLFDAHPALAAYPGELRFGYMVTDDWPPLDTRLGAEGNFRSLFDLKFYRLMRRGYVKGGGKILSEDGRELIDRSPERYRFLLVPRVQYLVFKELFKREPPESQREILNHFFTSHFNAWLDYQGHLEDKRWITSFAPRLAIEADASATFFDNYPDGRLIQIIRDPWSWYSSAKRHRRAVRHGTSSQELLEMWSVSAESMLRNKSRNGDGVIIVAFEDLIDRTEPIMRRLARELGIAYTSILLEPTFNGRTIRANSSFATEESGVIKAPLACGEMLSGEERQLIETHCLDLYERVAAKALQVG